MDTVWRNTPGRLTNPSSPRKTRPDSMSGLRGLEVRFQYQLGAIETRSPFDITSLIAGVIPIERAIEIG